MLGLTIFLRKSVFYSATKGTYSQISPSAISASFHEDDYQFFYNNLKENVAKRIATYKAKQ